MWLKFSNFCRNMEGDGRGGGQKLYDFEWFYGKEMCWYVSWVCF